MGGAYRESLVIVEIGIKNMNVWAVELCGDLLFSRLNIADETDDSVCRVFGKLSEIFKLKRQIVNTPQVLGTGIGQS